MIGSNAVKKYLLYAIGEILLVVVGILIALQINNWNQYRKDRVLEKEIINDLILNLEENNSILEDRVDYFERGQKACKIILNVIENELSFHDSLGTHFSFATRGYGGADIISFIGYEVLRNNGFGLIKNKFLKDEILGIFEGTYRDLISIDETFKQQNTYRNVVVGKLFFTNKANSMIPFEFNEIIHSNEYYALVAEHLNNYQWMNVETKAGVAKTKQVLEFLKNELAKSEF